MQFALSKLFLTKTEMEIEVEIKLICYNLNSRHTHALRRRSQADNVPVFVKVSQEINIIK